MTNAVATAILPPVTRVAGFSSRGNVGIGTEGVFGRYKPDVCAPGTFIISTRSEQWDINSYFYQDPTNNLIGFFTGILVQPDSLWKNFFPILSHQCGAMATINIFTPLQSAVSFHYPAHLCRHVWFSHCL